jgi:glycosyltransferase involved in cell wall biosynthesis
MRVCILEGNADVTAGGAEKSMASFCDFLIEAGHEVYLICEKKSNYTFKGLSVVGVLEVNTQPVRAQGVFGFCKSFFTIQQFLQRHNVEVLLTHTIHAFALLRILKFFVNIRVVVYLKWIYYGDSLGFLSNWGIKGLDQVIAINAYVGDYWSKFTKSLVTSFVPDGVPSSVSASAPEVDKRLLFLGRIYEGKGLHLLLESMELLEEDCTLDVVGFFDAQGDHAQSEYHRFIQELVSKPALKGRVRFHGLQKQTERFYSSASLIVVPSVWGDAQPLVILEAMASSKIVIGSAVGGIPSIFSGELESLVFKPDKFALSEKINEIFCMDSKEKGLLKYKLNRRFSLMYRADITQKRLELLVMTATQ